MSLHWIFGSSGSGKDYYLYNTIIRLSKENPSGKYIVIVPEQFTMQTQKDMVMLSDNKGIMNIDILSFMRLAYRVLAETPELEKPVLADEGKAMVIRKLLREHSAEWKTFGQNILKPGFVEEVKSVITEFIQYDLSVKDIEDIKENIGKKRLLSAKLEDLTLLYGYYTEYMKSRYISAEEMLKLLAYYAPDSELLRDSVIAITGFTGFTPVQYVLLKKLFGVCRDVYIAVTIGKDTDPFMPCKKHDLFYMSTEYIRKCMDLAAECGVYVEEPVRTGKDGGNIPWRFADNPEMRYLERYLFRDDLRRERLPVRNGAVNIYEAANPYEETGYVLWQINRLVKRHNLRYRDIAVVTGDTSLYGRLFEAEFGTAGIPYFIDYNRSILHNSFIDMILSLLAVCEKGFKYDTVIRFLRNGIVKDYLGFDSDSTDMLENFVRTTGVRGKKTWERQWTYEGRSGYDMDAVNDCRERIMSLLSPFYDGMREAQTVLEHSKVLYSFITENNINVAISGIAQKYGEAGRRTEQKEYDQIYRIFIGLIDQMTRLMGDEKLNTRDFTELLKTGINEAAVGIIPMGTDAVIVGDIERTRLKDIKVLFFAGVNDGIIPKALSAGGFISDIERQHLAQLGAQLAPTTKERAYAERFYLYLNATKPSERLYISYSRKSCAGAELRPSSFVKQIDDIIGGVEIKKDYSKWGVAGRLANDDGMDWWLKGLRECAKLENDCPDKHDGWIGLHKRYMKNDKNRQLFERAFFTGETGSMSKQTGAMLYNHEIIASISRLEKFGACAFAHFLEYGLKLRKRNEYQIKEPDMGIVFHSILERFAAQLSNKNMSWKDAKKELIDTWCEEICDTVCEQYNNGIFADSAKNEYMIERIKRISKRTIYAVAYQMQQGQFEQTAYEISFRELSHLSALNYDLGNGDIMRLTGKIDRIDTYETDDSIYVRIIDYKSGKSKLEIENIYHGLDMQLPVYLMAAEEALSSTADGKTVVPAGMFYVHIDDPVIDADKTDVSNIEESMHRQFIMNGLVCDREDVIGINDGKLAGKEAAAAGAKSDVVNVGLNKGGAVAKRSDAVPMRYFDYIKKAVTDKMLDYGRRIIDGEIGIEPYKIKNSIPCTYCEYSSVCGFDVRFEGNSYRKLTDISKEDVWKEWEEKYGGIHETTAEGD